MKVLVISHMYPSNFNHMSGIFVHQQVKALVENGCEVKVISPIPWTPFPLNKMSEKWRGYSNIPDKEVIDSIEVFYPRYLEFPRGIMFHKSGTSMAIAIGKIAKLIYKDFKFDIIHSNVALPDGYGTMVVNEKFKVPHIVTVHGQDFQNTINRNEKCRKALFKVMNKVDSIITVSNKLKNVVKNEDFYKKIVVINNGICKEFIEDTSHKNHENQNIKILSVSNLKKTKGIQLNIKAINNLKNKYPNIQYDIIGKGEYEPELKNLVEKLHLQKHVNFLGKIEHEDVINFMKEYDIFSLPSYSEGFGMVYIEAMSQGVASIGVKGEGIEDVIVHGYNGFLVDRENVDSLESTLETLIKDIKLRNDIGLKGKETVINNFTWDCNAKKVIQLYNKLTNKVL